VEKTTGEAFIELAKAQTESISRFLGTEIVEISPGHARVKMAMKPEYLNFYGVVFGGIIMSLADQAFGCAVNSLKYPSLAVQFNTYFLTSAYAGDELTAEAKVIRSGRRVSVAEVRITNQNGKLIATANGTDIAVEKS
jgi:acyl-CoA thioesterase